MQDRDGQNINRLFCLINLITFLDVTVLQNSGMLLKLFWELHSEECAQGTEKHLLKT